MEYSVGYRVCGEDEGYIAKRIYYIVKGMGYMVYGKG